jgi:hypothetical protein
MVVWLAQMVAVMPSMRATSRGSRRPDVAVVQDDAAAAEVKLEPQGAALVPLLALLARGGPVGRAVSVSAGLRECHMGPAGRPPAVVSHPMRDRVAGAGGLVAGPTDLLPDLGGELLLQRGVAGGEDAPCGPGDEGGEVDGFGVGGGEDTGGAEVTVFGAARDEDLGAAGSPPPGGGPLAVLVGPQVPTDEEAGQHRVVGDRRAVAAQQAQVAPLRLDDVGELGPRGVAGCPASGGPIQYRCRVQT